HGPADPGIGFAIGLERVVLLLGDDTPPSALRVLMIPLGESALRRLLPVAREVRHSGLGVELGYGARKLPRELERANRLGAQYAVIAGDNELGRGEVLVRDMASGTQRSVPLDRLAAELATLADGRPRQQ